MCMGGYTGCEDKSHLRACNPQLTCIDKSGHANFTHTNVTTINSDLVKGHSFCAYELWNIDNDYGYITREDEDNLDIASANIAPLNFANITNCTGVNGDDGIMCGTECVDNWQWCKLSKLHCDDGSQIFTTKDPVLCRNTTFWSAVNCQLYDADIIIAHGLRCTGSNQHCYYPWYVTINWVYEVGFMQSYDLMMYYRLG